MSGVSEGGGGSGDGVTVILGEGRTVLGHMVGVVGWFGVVVWGLVCWLIWVREGGLRWWRNRCF